LRKPPGSPGQATEALRFFEEFSRGKGMAGKRESLIMKTAQPLRAKGDNR